MKADKTTSQGPNESLQAVLRFIRLLDEWDRNQSECASSLGHEPVRRKADG